MYFVHPKIRCTPKNLLNIFSSFFQKPNLAEIKKIESLFPQKKIIFTDTGRTAFKLIIEVFSLQNSEMLFPAYICDIFWPILKRYNIKPIFLDIDKDTFHIRIDEIKRKITKNTKSILICHTYGLPVNIEKIKMITNNKLIIIEDCAHSFLAQVNGNLVGNLGDAAIFSLYKQFPIVKGGIAVIDNKKEIKNIRLAKRESLLTDFILLLNKFPFLSYLFLKFKKKFPIKIKFEEKLKKNLLKIDKINLNLFLKFQKDFKKELKFRKNLSVFFQEELKKLGFSVQKRENNIFCYVSALVPQNINRDKLVEKLAENKIFCSRIWYHPIIFLTEVQRKYKVNLDEFKNTREVAERIINFPLQNYYSKNEIKKIISTIRKVITCI